MPKGLPTRYQRGGIALNKTVLTSQLFCCNVPYLKDLFESSLYPWDILPRIGELIEMLLHDIPNGFRELKKGVLVGENVKIADNVTISGPAVIGGGCELRPGVFIRGNVITGENCVLGNSCEYKNCILLDKVQTPHYNYIGDSILGNNAHTGAGTICSNLKSDKKEVVVKSDVFYQTGLRKLGAILADGADIGSGCVLNPGTVVGKNTSVYPMTVLRGVYPSDSIVKARDIIVQRKEEIQ